MPRAKLWLEQGIQCVEIRPGRISTPGRLVEVANDRFVELHLENTGFRLTTASEETG